MMEKIQKIIFMFSFAYNLWGDTHKSCFKSRVFGSRKTQLNSQIVFLPNSEESMFRIGLLSRHSIVCYICLYKWLSAIRQQLQAYQWCAHTLQYKWLCCQTPTDSETHNSFCGTEWHSYAMYASIDCYVCYVCHTTKLCSLSLSLSLPLLLSYEQHCQIFLGQLPYFFLCTTQTFRYVVYRMTPYVRSLSKL